MRKFPIFLSELVFVHAFVCACVWYVCIMVPRYHDAANVMGLGSTEDV